MKYRWTYITAMTVFTTLTISFPVAAQNHPGKSENHVRYIVKDLGTLGGTQGTAEGVSDRGWVVGSANLAGNQSGHAFLWRDGKMMDLGTLGGVNSQEQWPVKDNRGLIVGTSEISQKDPNGENFCTFDGNSGVPPTGLICLGFIWRDGEMKPLSPIGGNNSYAAGVNNRGQAVGWAENSTQDTACNPPQVLDFEAVIWGPRRDQIQQLPPLSGDTVSAASGINDRGQVIGCSGLCSDLTSHGVLWHDGTITDLGNLGGVLNTIPWAINSHGYVVGQSDLVGDSTLHAFIWTKDDGMQDIGTLPGDSASAAFGTNERDQVVGGSCVDATFNQCRAFLWEDGVMVDVNSLVPKGSTPLYLFFGNDINDGGEIAAYAYDLNNDQFHAALAVPCDERHGGTKDCDLGDVAVDEHPKVILPENLRLQLQRWLGPGRFGGR